MRFLHTGDWQMGMRARHLGSGGARIREERFAAAERVVGAARETGAEFLLVAGDLFEHPGVDRGMVQRVADLLDRAPCPVFVLPGNHDPLGPGSVWEHPSWGRCARVRVLREEAPVPLPGGTLYPCPCRSRWSSQDPTGWIPPEGGAGFRVGLAHGTVEGLPSEEPDRPIPRDGARRLGLDYLALGHFHSVEVYPDPDGAVRQAYSGTHEATRFGERNSGNVLLVTLEAGVPPRVEPVRTGGFRWLDWERELAHPGDLEALVREVESLREPGATVLGLTLRGLLGPEEEPEVQRLEQLLESRFPAARLDREGLGGDLGNPEWVEELPPGVLRETARILGEQGEDPEAASAALRDLYVLWREVGR